MTPKQLRSAAHALRTAANALEEVTTQLRALSTEIDTPADPDGPVWDSHGKRWTPTGIDGWWLRDVTGVQRSWAYVLERYGPLTSTPPWKPEVGGTVETAEQYEAMPDGSVVCIDNSSVVHVKASGGIWYLAGSTGEYRSRELSDSTPLTILRVGWES